MMSWIRALIILLATPVLLSGLCATAYADSSPSLTALVYKKIIESQTALQEKKLDTSQAILEGIANSSRNTAYDNAMIWHMLGYVYYEQGDLKKAAATFEKVFDFDIPDSLSINNHKILGQVYMAQDQYQNALPHLRLWLESSTTGNEEVHAMMAHCYYQTKQYKSAASHLQSAIDSYRAQGKTPQESWLNLLQASLAQLNDVKHRIGTIKLLLAWFPKKEYWLALASAYAQLEQMDKYLAILALAERQDLLTSESQYVSLASVYFAEGAPQKTAQILEQGMERGLVRRNVRNLRFLASAYTMARDHEKALTPLQEAAAQADNGELDIMLGNALFQLARWQDASKALAQGLDKGAGVKGAEEKGGLQQNTTAWLLLGQSLLNLKQYDNAIAAFEQAALDETRNAQAQQWIKYARYEKERQENLKSEANPS